MFAGGVASPLFAMVTVKAGTDPWLGAHAGLLCPRVCEGCRGPYEVRGGTRVNGSARRGARAAMYCQPPRGSLADVPSVGDYELENGSLWVIAGAGLVVMPTVALLSFLALTLLGRSKGARGPGAAAGRPRREPLQR